MKSIEERYALATEEAQRQVDSGLIQGAVFASNLNQDLVTVGAQNVHPQVRPMTAQSRFDMASTGKTFTALCCALLIERGKLDPDAPFADYLPGHILRGHTNVTVRDLAMHVSGYNNNKAYSSKVPSILDRELMRMVPPRPRLDRFEYACGNFILLGKIVEQLSGTDLGTFARENIWKPLGMSHTTWDAPGDGPDEVEHWFPNRPAGVHNDWECNDYNKPLGSGSCFSTCGDMMLYLNDMLTRKTFPQACYDLLMTCGFEKNGARRSFGWDMSLSERTFDWDGKPVTGSTVFSSKAIYHSGWTGQTLCVDPANGFCAAILTSRTGDWQKAYDGRMKIAELLFSGK